MSLGLQAALLIAVIVLIVAAYQTGAINRRRDRGRVSPIHFDDPGDVRPRHRL